MPGEKPSPVAGGATWRGGDVGVAVLTVDADGEVAQTGHGAREKAGMDLGVELGERAVADVVQKIFDLPVPSDPVGGLGAGNRTRRQAGDQGDALDGELAAREVLPPAGGSGSEAVSRSGVFRLTGTPMACLES
ncbi:hypothetical protein [Streptomyces hokutonensis]|uniref:hypothetical protein n=1 Tax=Streptomyces hokutonensis TaxID=1306990 RepID=UPI00367A1560